MNKKNVLIALMLISIAPFTFGEEIILQNGDDYSGCEDTYISDDPYQTDNFGDETMCSLQGYH